MLKRAPRISRVDSSSNPNTYHHLDQVLMLEGPVHLGLFHCILDSLTAKGTTDLLQCVQSPCCYILHQVYKAESTVVTTETMKAIVVGRGC